MNSALSPDDAAAICRHMNDDHADAVAAYARCFANIAEVRSATMLGMDGEGIELSVETEPGRVVARVEFDHVLADTDDARETLIAMARRAMADA